VRGGPAQSKEDLSKGRAFGRPRRPTLRLGTAARACHPRQHSTTGAAAFATYAATVPATVSNADGAASTGFPTQPHRVLTRCHPPPHGSSAAHYMHVTVLVTVCVVPLPANIVHFVVVVIIIVVVVVAVVAVACVGAPIRRAAAACATGAGTAALPRITTIPTTPTTTITTTVVSSATFITPTTTTTSTTIIAAFGLACVGLGVAGLARLASVVVSLVSGRALSRRSRCSSLGKRWEGGHGRR